MIHREDQDSIAVLRIEHGKANALDTELLQALSTRLAEVEANPPGAVVLTGTGRMFSAGVDLFRLLDGGDDYLSGFLTALDASFRALFTCSLPVVGAINGHAIAGGCVLAAACDHRVMANGGAKIGTTELLVGVPFPTSALEVVRHLLAPHRASELIYGGATHDAAGALERGLVDEAVADDQVLPRAVEIARTLAAIPSATFALTKRQLRRPAVEAIETGAAAFDGEVKELWSSGDVRGVIERYLDSVVRDKRRAR